MNLQEFIQKAKQVRDEAAQGKWLLREDYDYYQGGSYIGVGPVRYMRANEPGYTIPVPIIDCAPEEATYFKTDTCRSEDSKSGEFITFSANHWNTLLKIIELQGEVIQDTIDSGYDQAGHCFSAQSEISKLLEDLNGKA